MTSDSSDQWDMNSRMDILGRPGSIAPICCGMMRGRSSPLRTMRSSSSQYPSSPSLNMDAIHPQSLTAASTAAATARRHSFGNVLGTEGPPLGTMKRTACLITASTRCAYGPLSFGTTGIVTAL